MPPENWTHLKAPPTPPPYAPTPLLARRQDVVTRRAEGAVFKGNLKALGQFPSHLGQAFRLKAHEAGILAQNYLLAHLLKGGLKYIHIYIYINLHFITYAPSDA